MLFMTFSSCTCRIHCPSADMSRNDQDLGTGMAFARDVPVGVMLSTVSGGVRMRMVAHSCRVEVEAEQPHDDHCRHHQGVLPDKQTALGDDAEPSHTDEHERLNEHRP